MCANCANVGQVHVITVYCDCFTCRHKVQDSLKGNSFNCVSYIQKQICTIPINNVHMLPVLHTSFRKTSIVVLNNSVRLIFLLRFNQQFYFDRVFYLKGRDGKEVKLDDLINQFSSDNCPALAGKPKLFLIQACRGGNLNYNVISKNFYFAELGVIWKKAVYCLFIGPQKSQVLLS